jgi:homoserine O-succinyltransferase
LIIDGGRVPTRWAARQPASSKVRVMGEQGVRIAFIDNMPDAALEDTEMQFFGLLDAAAGNTSVHVKLFSLPHVPRSETGKAHIESFYSTLDGLWNAPFDGLIMTGTEPRSANLQDEPYWNALAEVLDWAERNTASTVLSCLAAHAGVLHCDGIPRHPLPDKQFGIFDCKKTAPHALTRGAGDWVSFPHSRWNEVREDELLASGYSVLTKSPHAGVDLFVKQKKKSLFVHFQGHPEYGAQTLFKEYRRDVKRFLRQERNTYPSMPHGYFDSAASETLNQFREKAIASRDESLIAEFPASASTGLKKTWETSANSVYRNWLKYVASKAAGKSRFSAAPSFFEKARRKRTALP